MGCKPDVAGDWRFLDFESCAGLNLGTEPLDSHRAHDVSFNLHPLKRLFVDPESSFHSGQYFAVTIGRFIPMSRRSFEYINLMMVEDVFPHQMESKAAVICSRSVWSRCRSASYLAILWALFSADSCCRSAASSDVSCPLHLEGQSCSSLWRKVTCGDRFFPRKGSGPKPRHDLPSLKACLPTTRVGAGSTQASVRVSFTTLAAGKRNTGISPLISIGAAEGTIAFRCSNVL